MGLQVDRAEEAQILALGAYHQRLEVLLENRNNRATRYGSGTFHQERQLVI